MSKDVQFFCACNHIVNTVQYERNLCPRCYGKGYYLDIYFDLNGQTVLASGNIKLQQEILKSILDEKYQNPFHPNWGSEIKSAFIGAKNIGIIKSKIEVVLRNSLNYLKNVQLTENQDWNNIKSDEILNVIEHIEITPLGPTGYNVVITFSNVVGDRLTQEIII